MSLSVKSIEPNWFDILTVSPFVLSQSLVEKEQSSLKKSRWHFLWIMPVSLITNAATSALLLVSTLVNVLAGALFCKSHQFTTAHDCLFYMGVSFVRLFWAPFNPLSIVDVQRAQPNS